ncbi:MAG: DUF4270 domain-containing protein [Fermentimonas sp.]|jgi:hypothetical protein|nr:DUF4270 domain-containing protein [Fermentimonas sp.]MDD3510786.1 DUF4270 domain-containing protein [Fermentimonas sp.]MDD4284808.1 DUF4270 domain-containing protein [Fermentimonas sp.]
MKLKTIYKLLIITFVTILSVSCNDTLDQVGFTIQPGKDRLAVGIDTLQLQARTVQVDSMFGETNYPVLGEYADPVFGSIKSEYIAEFYLPKGMDFKEGAIIDSVRVEVAYTSIVGDSIAPMRLSVYKVAKSLKGFADYTNVDPKKFADMSELLGEQIFTGRNSTYRNRSFTAEDYSTVNYKEYYINVEIPNSIGESFLTEYKKPGNGKLSDTDTFREFFPGLYFTTSFGNSTILSADMTSLFIYYKYNDVKGSSTGQDTIRTGVFKLNNTPEVRQINHIESNNIELLKDNPTYTYIKSPAGVNTELKFPISEIHENLQSKALNLVNFTVYALPDASDNEMVKLSPPDYLLLINKDSLNGFFENRKLRDNVTSFLSEKFDASTYSYKFNNISSLINYYNQANDGEPYDLVYYLIPVEATYSTVQQGYSSQQMLTKIQNLMWPTATVLDKREGSLQLELIFSDLQ